MRLRSKKYLEDVRMAAEAIFEFTGGRKLDEYSRDMMFRSAVERQFEIIGEALNQLSRFDIQTVSRIDEYQEIISFRNKLIHGYDLIEDKIVWDAIKKQLPALHKRVVELLTEETEYDN
jgi:uncharacterized protein with HEPN domain